MKPRKRSNSTWTVYMRKVEGKDRCRKSSQTRRMSHYDEEIESKRRKQKYPILFRNRIGWKKI